MRAIHAILPPLGIVLAGALLLSITYLGALVAVFGALDTRGRYRDYKYLKDKPYLTYRMADFYGRSYCGRHLIKSLALPVRSTVGIIWHPWWNWYYADSGYRWYHFLPDGFPSFLVNRNFWKALFNGHRAV